MKHPRFKHSLTNAN